ALISDENNKGVASGIPWLKGPIPNEYAITGLGPVFFRINKKEYMDHILTKSLFMGRKKEEGNFILYEMGEGGNGASVILELVEGMEDAVQGYGGVHHVAFRVRDEKVLRDWIEYITELGARHS